MGVAMPAPRARPTRRLRVRGGRCIVRRGPADGARVVLTRCHRPKIRKADGRPLFAPAARRWSAGDGGKPLRAWPPNCFPNRAHGSCRFRPPRTGRRSGAPNWISAAAGDLYTPEKTGIPETWACLP